MKIKECVIKYIKSLSIEERKQLKIMLQHNILCCRGYAIANNLDPDVFNAELKAMLQGDK